MTDRCPGLDAVRGLAVAIVVWSHGANDGFLPGWAGRGAGQMGVLLFFVLSGFLMMRLYGGTPITRAALHRFAIARAGRVVPLFTLVVLASALAAALGAAPHYRFDDAGAVMAALLWLRAPQELWSVPVEIQFYALFPLLWAVRPRAAAVGAAAILSLPIAALWAGPLGLSDGLPLYLPAFLIGAGLGAVPATVLKAAGRPWVIALCTLFLIATLPGPRAALGAEVWSGFYPRFWLDPIRLSAAGALVAAAAGAQGLHMGLWPLAALGHVSFGVYLFHRPVTGWIDALGMPAVATAPLPAIAVLGISWALAWASLRLFERPVARALRSGPGAPPLPARPQEAA